MLPVLVTGATGNTGRLVAAGLRQLGVEVREGSRRGHPAFQWYDQSTWRRVLDGVGAVYIATPITAWVRKGEQSPPVGFAADAVEEFVEVAVTQGVQRLVLLAGRSARAEPVNEFMVDLERPVRQSDVEWTVLSPSVFSQSFALSPVREGIAAGHVDYIAVSDEVPIDFTDVTDIAEAAVRVLTTPGHGGMTYELSGPRALTEREAIAIISRTLGREITSRRIDLQQALQSGSGAGGLTEDSMALIDMAIRGRATSAYSLPSNGIQQLLDREPRSFEEFVRQAAASGVWTSTTEIT